MKNLFALLIGINEYTHIRNLSSCAIDVQRVSGFLSAFSANDFAYHEKILLSKAATKRDIVEAFQAHLIAQPVQAGDVLLFYFSGHGAEQQAHPAFWKTDTNQRLQVLACADSNPRTGENFLADKELRYLIHKAAKPHVDLLAIFDCCHAGDNTRSTPPMNIRERLAGYAPQSLWSSFIFAHEVTPETILEKTLEVAIPQGRHIQIAACDTHESAYEKDSDGGFFTKAMIDVLEQTRGDISYLDLKNQVKNAIRQMNLHEQSMPQTPKIYAFNGQQHQLTEASQDMLFRTFLNGITKDKPLPAEVYFNRQLQRWEVDRGAIYGVCETWKDTPQQVVVPVDADTVEYATIIKVYPGCSVVAFEPYAAIYTGERYNNVQIPSLLSRALRIAVRGAQQGVHMFLQGSPEDAMARKGIFLADEEHEAAYCVLAQNNQYLITLPNDTRPLTKAIAGYTTQSVQDVHEVLQKLVKWNYLKQLMNPGVTELNDAFDVRVTQYERDIQPDGDSFTLIMPGTNKQGLPTGKMSLILRNRTQQPLYYGAIYLSTLFGINEQIIEGGVMYLDPNKDHYLRNNIGIALEPFIRDFNWREETYHILLIGAASPFSLDLFRQREAQAPVTSKEATPLNHTGAKDIALDERNYALDSSLWQTRLLTFHLPNPYYSE